MAKRKNSMALFEVISQGRGKQGRKGLKVPGYARPQEPTNGGETAAEGQWQGGEEPARPEAPEPTPPESAPAPRLEPVAGHSEPLIRTEGGRLRISLNYVSCSVVLGTVLVLLVLAFVLGRASVSPERAPGETVAAGMGGGAGQGEQASEPAAEPAQPAAGTGVDGRTSGRYYLVIQAMGGLTPELQAQAEEIARYCTDVGHPATVARSKTEYLVWSQEGFDSPDGEQARQYAAQIHELGKRYRALPGAEHDFSQRDESGQLRPWFEPAP